METRIARTALQILIEQPQTIENWTHEKIYLDPKKFIVARQGVYVIDEGSAIEIPFFAMDNEGPYLLCNSSAVSAEAQQHYDAGTQAAVDAVIHAINAGSAIIIIPPLGILEGYKAVKSIQDAAKFYIEGLKVEGKILNGVEFPPIGGLNP